MYRICKRKIHDQIEQRKEQKQQTAFYCLKNSQLDCNDLERVHLTNDTTSIFLCLSEVCGM